MVFVRPDGAASSAARSAVARQTRGVKGRSIRTRGLPQVIFSGTALRVSAPPLPLRFEDTRRLWSGYASAARLR